MANGGTRTVLGIIGMFFAAISMAAGLSTRGQEEMLFQGICCGTICLLLVISGNEAKKSAALRLNQNFVYVQQGQINPAAVAVGHVQTPPPKPSTPKPSTPPKDKEKLIRKAKNLETARDWEGAAKAYQEAELYAEAGRVREEHLEKDKDKVVLNIDRIGDTVLNDSVMMNENSESQNSNDIES